MDFCETPEWYTETYPIAKKTHHCCECHRPIPKGTQYARCAGKFDGTVFTETQHQECRDFAAELNQEYSNSDGGCFIPFGGVDNFINNMRDWPKEPAPNDAETLKKRWALVKSGAAAMDDSGIVTDPCCDDPKLTFVRDERVSYAAILVDGKLFISKKPIETSGGTFDEDDPTMWCETCGAVRQLPDGEPR